MNIPINFAKWRVENLPAGLSVKNGIISGTPSVEVGTYDIPFSVITPWGTDTKNIKIYVREKSKYAIYKNGEKFEEISLDDLLASIRNGTAQEKYDCINTQIKIPITTPAIKYRYYDTVNSEFIYAIRQSQIDMATVNFCSFRNVTLEDGTVKPALIFQFDKTIWLKYCCFDTGDIVSRPNKVTPHYEIENLMYLCNRWKYSNIRQWLNSSGINWFTSAYDTDVFLTFSPEQVEYSLMRNTDSIGFLSCLPDDLLDAIKPIKIQTQAFFDEDNFDESIVEPDIINDVYVDTTYDKIFIPSLEEMNIKPSDNDGYVNGKKIYADDGIEGTAWEYYINKFNSNSRFLSGSTFTDIEEWGKNLGSDFADIPYYDKNSEENFFQYVSRKRRGQLTRSAQLDSPNSIWQVFIDEEYSTKGLEVSNQYVFEDYYSYSQPAPAFALC